MERFAEPCGHSRQARDGGRGEERKRLRTMTLITQSRLSVQPVSDAEWAVVCNSAAFDDAEKDRPIHAKHDAGHGRMRMEPMDLLADTRRYLADAIRQLAAIEAGAPIAKPLKREEAINIVTEQIGLFESVLRRYGGKENRDLRSNH